MASPPPLGCRAEEAWAQPGQLAGCSTPGGQEVAEQMLCSPEGGGRPRLVSQGPGVLTVQPGLGQPRVVRGIAKPLARGEGARPSGKPSWDQGSFHAGTAGPGRSHRRPSLSLESERTERLGHSAPHPQFSISLDLRPRQDQSCPLG